jgi:SOS-response transcriptional repressor LexA
MFTIRNMEYINEIIKRRAKVLGLKQVDIVRKTGATKGTVSKWFSGDRKPEEYLPELCRILKLDIESLKNGKLVESNVVKYVGSDYNAVVLTANKEVPLIDYVAAGDWADIEDPFAMGDGYEMLVCPVKHSENTFALRINGDSMLDKFHHGEIIFCDPRQNPKSGDYVVAKLTDDNQATFKQLMIEDGKMMLKALNKDWPVQYLPINGNCHIVGKVIARLEAL